MKSAYMSLANDVGVSDAAGEGSEDGELEGFLSPMLEDEPLIPIPPGRFHQLPRDRLFMSDLYAAAQSRSPQDASSNYTYRVLSPHHPRASSSRNLDGYDRESDDNESDSFSPAMDDGPGEV